MRGVRNLGGNQSRNPSTGFRYQGGGGIVGRVGSFNGANNTPHSSGGSRNTPEASKVTSITSVVKPGGSNSSGSWG